MEGDLPIVDYNNYELLPSVSMYSSLRHGLGNPAVRCNFTGPFRYPIEGFEGYGADIGSRRRNSMQRKWVQINEVSSSEVYFFGGLLLQCLFYAYDIV